MATTEREPVYIFHIYRREGTSLFLHPFLSPEKLVAHMEKSFVEGRYGLEPRVEALTLFRNDLYRQVEAGVRSWLNDVRFIPKFLISTGVFLLVYFFLSYVILDPIPVLDELAGGLGASILSYILLGKRDLASQRAAQKRLALRVAVDRIVFRDSPFVKRVEETLHRHEAEGIEEVIRRIVEPAQQVLESPLKAEALQFLDLLESRFNFKRLKREERVFKRYVKDRQRIVHSRNLRRIIQAKKLDFSLYAVYKSFKKTVAQFN